MTDTNPDGQGAVETTDSPPAPDYRYFACIDGEGYIQGFYVSPLNTPPEDAIEIIRSDYNRWLTNPAGLGWRGGALVEVEPVPPPQTRFVGLTTADLWGRLSDAEAEVFDTRLADEPIRFRRLIGTGGTFYAGSDDLASLRGMLVDLFGEERALAVVEG